jgi:hypothetical protein
MKSITYLFLLFIFLSCSSEDFSLRQYEKYPVKFAKQKVNYPNYTFELFIPKHWEWNVENFDNTDEIILGINAWSKQDEKNYMDAISIQKTKGLSAEKNLKAEYEIILGKLKQNLDYKLIESGKSSFFENETYFLHYKSNSGNYGAVEIISLITESKSDKGFYYINASASRTKNLKMNMSMMLQCLKTFKQR